VGENVIVTKQITISYSMEYDPDHYQRRLSLFSRFFLGYFLFPSIVIFLMLCYLLLHYPYWSIFFHFFFWNLIPLIGFINLINAIRSGQYHIDPIGILWFSITKWVYYSIVRSKKTQIIFVSINLSIKLLQNIRH